ncbi:hypothetical protein RN04_02710 [Arthrobacter sp. W1]|nr:hypothetical protein RN04_02710 [Arthrobacter sp. W1]
MTRYKLSDEPKLISPKDLIGASTVGQILGITRTQVARRVQSGALPAFTKLDGPLGAYVFDRNDIEAEAKK